MLIASSTGELLAVLVADNNYIWQLYSSSRLPMGRRLLMAVRIDCKLFIVS
jgi:hypothetical protein